MSYVGPIRLDGGTARIGTTYRDEGEDDCGAWEPNDSTVDRDCGSDGHYRCPQCRRFDAASFERRCAPELVRP